MMKKILIFAAILLGTLTVGQIFQSTQTPTYYSPFSTFTINGNKFGNSQFGLSNNFYSSGTAFNGPSSALNMVFPGIGTNHPGFPTAASISQLKDFRRTADGSSNNRQHPSYNSAYTRLARHSPALYKDGHASPMSYDSSPREASNALGSVGKVIQTDPNNVTSAFVFWGQFLDHDLGLSETNSNETMPIHIPKCDPFMDLECDGTKTIPFKRSISMPDTTVRDQMNSVTGWNDASQVYGSTKQVADRLRTFQMGKMKVGEHNMLPLMKGDKHGLNDAGDIRANQNILLTSYHTIFVREHNRMCKMIILKEPFLSDQQIYQAAKNYVTGLIQKITFRDYLPVLLGPDAYKKEIGAYSGYKENIDPTLEIQFTTAAFRFGHALLIPKYPLVGENGTVESEIGLSDMFFHPDLLNPEVMDKLLRGLTRSVAKKKDGTIINDVRNMLVTDPALRQMRMDLYALNLQRARDHGLEQFNYMRMSYGFPPLQSFTQLTGDTERAKVLEDFYKDVNKVDPWVGILNEKSLDGGILGEVGARIVGQNFRRLRDGDRFWYQRDFPASVVVEIETTTLADVIVRNSGILELPKDIFHYNGAS